MRVWEEKTEGKGEKHCGREGGRGSLEESKEVQEDRE